MEPIKIKLTYWELVHLRDYLFQAFQIARNPQAREELIVLAEFLPKAEQQLITAGRRSRSKAYLFTLPLSVARILHRRWQQQPITAEMQMILNALDYELTRCGMKSATGRLQLL
ncbi:hypothetical protein [Arundinibacter roseus]|uniref:Uncharacterized protein n=1 Tax=Arundinibacter roseus TaxID=2070510 RepID=A0A4R4KL71_9BACT|nr:hypothetical protein [Arundinibacter roseus]TDB69084.1 hypothetical protein EZE20_01750 [Arundinibacter roseus]